MKINQSFNSRDGAYPQPYPTQQPSSHKEHYKGEYISAFQTYLISEPLHT